MTTRILLAAALLALLSACTEPQTTYPITGEECGPGDPVQTVDPTFCPPAAGT
ncbi:MAG: hypothetical protein MUF63_15005 [Rhodobacteraceae bacterium]|jgi:hypothetical protein|nr:hypothetical protein [Paracoccaceae bacterium]